MKPGFYLDFTLVGYGGRSGKQKFVQHMRNCYAGRTRKAAADYDRWFHSLIEKEGSVRHVDKTVMFEVKQVKRTKA